MKFIRESVDLLYSGNRLTENSEKEIGQFLESCGRVCYKSEKKITSDSYKKFLDMIITSGHHSILEHVNISAKIITNRGVTHELIRHRLGAYSQESTRYCNYSSSRFGNEVTFIVPVWISDERLEQLSQKFTCGVILPFCPGDSTDPDEIWFNTLFDIERNYFYLLERGYTPEKAREVLPNSLATTIMTTYNLRQWIHVLRQRLSPQCHPQMRYLMSMIGAEFSKYLPMFFNPVIKSETVMDISSGISS